MTHERKWPGPNAVTTEGKSELIRAARTTSKAANDTESVQGPYSTKQTDSGNGTQTEVRSLRDELWEAINGIEEKAPGAPIERELIILDRVAERLGNTTSERDSDA